MGENAHPTRVACIQVSSLSPDDGEGPDVVLARVRSFEGRADIVVLPELWNVGYGNFLNYRRLAESREGRVVQAMAATARAAGVYLVGGSVIEEAGADLFNTTYVFSPRGDVIGTYRKIHLFGYQSQEAELLTPGDSPVTVDTEYGVLGLAICYDLRFPELFRRYSLRNVEIVIIPAAWPAQRIKHWALLARARALENQSYLVGCNGVGVQGGLSLGGQSLIVSPDGETLAEADAQPGQITADLSLGNMRRTRREFPVLADRRPRLSGVLES